MSESTDRLRQQQRGGESPEGDRGNASPLSPSKTLLLVPLVSLKMEAITIAITSKRKMAAKVASRRSLKIKALFFAISSGFSPPALSLSCSVCACERNPNFGL